MPPEEPGAPLQAIAAVGNAVALLLLVLLLAQSRFWQPGAPPPAGPTQPPASSPAPPARLLLVLCDGLRADVAADPFLMPELQRLAARGSRAVARVEALIPSTIAGVRAEVEGVNPPPAAFAYDFVSGAAPAGGFFAAERERGGRSFVAAPRLWTELYGAWIDEAVTTGQLDGEDQMLLEAALRQLTDGDCGVVVAHFSRPDVAAHLAGGASARYRAAASWCDGALAQLVRVGGPALTVLVTSDHGVTRSGGHAGTEPEVVQIPVIVAGPDAPRLPPTLRQVEVAGLVQIILGRPAALPSAASSSPAPAAWLAVALAASVSLTAAVLLLSLSPAGLQGRTAFWLHASLWIVIALSFRSRTGSAMAGCSALVGIAARAVLGNPLRAFEFRAGAACFAGILLGLWRAVGAPSSPVHPSLLLVCLALLPCGFLLTRYLGSFAGGAAALLLTGVCEEAFNGGASLSNLELHWPFVIALTPLGLPGAAVLAAIQPLAPALCCLLALLWRSRRHTLCAVTSGVGAVLAGEAFAAACLLARPPAGHEQQMSSLALATFIRASAETALLFPLFAAWSWLQRKRETTEPFKSLPPLS